MRKVCDVDGCAGCPLRNLNPDNTFVEPRLGTNLRLVIGEAPGTTEAEEGQPFVGGSGKVLRILYGKAGLKAEENSVINVIQCQPPNNVFPTDRDARFYISDEDAHKAVNQCLKNHVIPFIKSRPWKRVDTFGEKPLRFVLEKGNTISYWRGSVLEVPALDNARVATPTFHPSYLMRDQTMLPVAINDLRRSLRVDPERYSIFPSLDEVKRFTATTFAFDIETPWNQDEIIMVGLSASSYEAIVVPFHGLYIEELKRIFKNAKEVIGHNCIQFDLPILAKHDVVIGPPKECMVWDTMLMQHLRFPSFPHDLGFVGKQFTDKGAWKADKASPETYCARDVDVTFRCFEPLHSLLEQAGLLDVYKYVSWPLGRICKYMTDAGVYVSGEHLKTIRADFQKKIEETEQKLPPELRTTYVEKRKRIKMPPYYRDENDKAVRFKYEVYLKPTTPWRSSAVKKKYLYETLGLPVQRHIKTRQPTADKFALDKLYNKFKLPELRALKELNHYATILSGFAKEDLQRKEVIHPSFNVHGTDTGRLSSSNPNIQNQPPSIRYMFVSRYEGGHILASDYSGIENRITAHLAGDRTRAQWLADPKFSEHKLLASMMTGIPYEQVEKSKDKDSPYFIAKIVVHGSDRMLGAMKISEQFDISLTEVKKMQAAWKDKIRDTVRWQRSTGEAAKKNGWTRNAFKRMLWLWESNSVTRAVSFHPQSDAFDVIARAMIGLMWKNIDWPLDWAQMVTPVCEALPEKVIMFAQVHDELVFDIPPGLEEQTEQTVNNVMTQPWKELDGLRLPNASGLGPSWGECE